MMKRDDPNQLLLLADVLPNGHGGFVVTPRKPVRECGPEEAARILHCARSSLSNILDKPIAQRTIKWRWLSEAKGKRLFDVASLHAYREEMEGE